MGGTEHSRAEGHRDQHFLVDTRYTLPEPFFFCMHFQNLQTLVSTILIAECHKFVMLPRLAWIHSILTSISARLPFRSTHSVIF